MTIFLVRKPKQLQINSTHGISMIEFKSLKHAQYLSDLYAGLKQPLRFNLSDSCAQSLTFGQLMTLGDKTELEFLDLGSTTTCGNIELRQTIAQLHNTTLDSSCAAITANNVATFSGAQEGLFAIFNHLFEAGDEIVMFTPNYPALKALPEQLGIKVNTVELQFAYSWKIELDELTRHINSRTKAIVINSPQNPTGAVLSRGEANGLIALAEEYGLYLIVDEVSVWSNHQQEEIAHPFLRYDKTISIGVISKSFGLAGIRVGWVVSRDANLLQRLTEIKSYTSICNSAADEYLTTIALKQHEKILQFNNHLIKFNLGLFEDFVTRNRGLIQWHPPKGGILTIVKSNLDVSIETMAHDLAHDYQTLILPGHIFGLEGNFFRLGLGRTNFNDGLEQLQKYIDSVSGESHENDQLLDQLE